MLFTRFSMILGALRSCLAKPPKSIENPSKSKDFDGFGGGRWAASILLQNHAFFIVFWWPKRPKSPRKSVKSGTSIFGGILEAKIQSSIKYTPGSGFCRPKSMSRFRSFSRTFFEKKVASRREIEARPRRSPKSSKNHQKCWIFDDFAGIRWDSPGSQRNHRKSIKIA